MKRLILALAVAAIAYAAYWAVAARAARADALAFADRLRDAGWQVGWEDLRLRGFPSRVDLTVEAPALTPPSGAAAWAAPFIQSLQLSYDRSGRILAFADSQTLRIGRQDIEIASNGLRASLTGNRAVAEAERIALQAGGTRIEAGPVLLALRDLPGGRAELFVRATDLRADGVPAGELVLDLTFDAEPLIGRFGGMTIERLDIGAPEALARALEPLAPAAAAALRQRQ